MLPSFALAFVPSPVGPQVYIDIDSLLVAHHDHQWPVRNQIMAAGFPAPSQIQQYTWPLAMQGRDVIGVAATGSGKTLAFLRLRMAFF